ncbi:type VI secretion system-associated FHA domain protein TagH [Gallaecimonas mangrovi]|uniref:type VI secretion system-associated FHA domain protein TagH n=1 Tax=Gallaecimonas mangrovi TaxID=2291597 RepID=UPI000E1FC2C1|nr:type VI secretion system-associated FHA domain protein TagH [Gallaecimonas mangrovi]
MELELEITSYHRLSPSIQSVVRFSKQNQLLGRSEQCDWQLPDPDRVISSKHAEILKKEDAYWLKDISTNGVFINNSSQPLGKENQSKLSDGDVLRIGDYEIAVKMVSQVIEEKNNSINSAEAVSEEAEFKSEPLFEEASAPSPEPSLGFSSLASSLAEPSATDSHVELPKAGAASGIPTEWNWGKAPSEEDATEAPVPTAKPELIEALFEGLGMQKHFADKTPDAALMRELGNLTRITLERLLDLLHMRAEQKQKLRVQQTTFRRQENNPLKFSASAQDALESLVLRRHNSFLGPQDAVEEAFADIRHHEQALMAAVEQVVTSLLDTDAAVEDSALDKMPVLGKARAFERWQRQQQHLKHEYGDSDRMMRSDLFVDAYENAIRNLKQE